MAAVRAKHAVEVEVEVLGTAGWCDLHPPARHLAEAVDLQQGLVHVLAASHGVGGRMFVVRGRPDAAEDADVPLELLHRVVQRPADDGSLAKLSLALRQEPFEFVKSSFVVLRGLLPFVEAGRGGGRLRDGVAELSPRRRERVALLVVLLPEHLQPFL